MATLSRRRVLQGLGAGALVALTGCTRDPLTPSLAPSPSETASLGFPNRPGDSTHIDVAMYDGPFGTTFVSQAADLLSQTYPGVTATITPLTNVADELADSFVDGAIPPDLVGASGPDPLPLGAMVDDFTDLATFLTWTNDDGMTVADSLTENALAPGLIGQKQVAINYALSVHGLWYSAARFAAEGWSMPTTWDALLELGEEARSRDTFLFVYADECANYYQELAIAAAIKEGGRDVRVALDNLAEGAWLHPAVKGVLEQLESCVTAGYVLAGGAGAVAAQAQWSQDGRALLYPSGSWIAREMQGRTADGFEMTVAPVPTLTSSPTLPIAAAHLTPTQAFVVPAKANNPQGGQELLRSMLSVDVAAEFTRTNLTPTVVRNSAPADVTDSALTSQTRVIADAGADVFSWRFPTYYGLDQAQNALWKRFLEGGLTAATLAERLQALSDEAAADPSVQRYTVS